MTTKVLRKIANEARERNSRDDISGILHFESGVFFQWIEGPKESVHALFKAICADPRHRDIVKLSEIELVDRNFSFWSMATCYGDDFFLFDWAAQVDISLQFVKPGEILKFLLSCASRIPRGKAA